MDVFLDRVCDHSGLRGSSEVQIRSAAGKQPKRRAALFIHNLLSPVPGENYDTTTIPTEGLHRSYYLSLVLGPGRAKEASFLAESQLR
jgi:hypothetical protein